MMQTPSDITVQKITVATTLSLLVGLFTIFLGLARLGFMDSVIVSRPLLRGFVTAVACVIFIEQLGDLLGVSGDAGEELAESPFAKLSNLLLNHLHQTNTVTLCISIACMSVLFGSAWFKRRIRERELNGLPAEDAMWMSAGGYAPLITPTTLEPPTAPRLRWHRFKKNALKLIMITPEILVVVVTMIILSRLLGLQENYGVVILGTKTDGDGSGAGGGLKSGFMPLVLPSLTMSHVKALIMPALLISILGFVESTVAAKQYALKYHYSVSPNRELVAFGAINIIGSMLNCFPAFSSLARSQLNDQAGSKTQLSGFITAFGVLITVVALLGVFWWVPVCVLASVVCVAAYGLLEFEDVAFMIKIRAWYDMLMMLFTFCLTMFWSVEAGVLSSIGLSLLLVVKQTTRVKVSVLVKVPEIIIQGPLSGQGSEFGTSAHTSPVYGSTNVSPQQNQLTRVKYKYRPLEEVHVHLQQTNSPLPLQDILVVKIEEGLFFGNSGQLMDRLRRAEAYNGYLHTHPSEEAARLIRPANEEAVPEEESTPFRPQAPRTIPSYQSPSPLPRFAGSKDPAAALSPPNHPDPKIPDRASDSSSEHDKSRPAEDEYRLRRQSSSMEGGKHKRHVKKKSPSAHHEHHHHLIQVNLNNNDQAASEEDVSTDSVVSEDEASDMKQSTTQIPRPITLPIGLRQTSQMTADRNGSAEADSYLKAVIFDIENMPSIDASALHALHHIIEAYQSRSILVCFVKMRESVKTAFLRSGILGDLLGSEWFFRKISDAENYLRARLNLAPDHVLSVIEEGYSTYNVL